MSLLKRIFGKTKNDEVLKSEGQIENVIKEESQNTKESLDKYLSSVSNISNTPELFKKELYESLNRYYSTPDLNPSLNLTDKNGVTYKEHEAFNSTYNEWKDVRSVWDRRSILFSLWDSSVDELGKWQIVEKYVKDRYGLKAIEFHENNITNDDLQDIRLIVAMSKLYRVMNSYHQALYYAKGAYELRSDLDIVKVEYATVLHLSDSAEDIQKSHELMNEVIQDKIKQETSDSVALLNYFVFSKDYIDSSIFAAQYLSVGECDLETWDKLAEEYYWCPNFRYEHSVCLSKKGETLRAIAKLNSLADEFPWYKTGVLANVNAIRQLREQNNDPNFMSKEMNNMERYQSMWAN